MTHIITSLCLRDGACVEVCPVDCIPLDPDNVESQDELEEKYDRLMAEEG